jgi:hypothetical protein
MNAPVPPHALSDKDARDVLALRLLIARAANSDSLAWWGDDSLTPPAVYVLERLFPIAPPLAARSLALTAAQARHRDAFPKGEDALHLFRLDQDNQDRYDLRLVPLLEVPVSAEPITTMNMLRESLLALVGTPKPYTVLGKSMDYRLQIAVPHEPAGLSPLLHRAQTLAWAYLEGAPGESLLLFVLEKRS